MAGGGGGTGEEEGEGEAVALGDGLYEGLGGEVGGGGTGEAIRLMMVALLEGGGTPSCPPSPN